MIYHGFASKLHHEVPDWVEPGALFHIRIRLELTLQQPLLTESALATRLLDSARFYETKHTWHITIFLLMPDHIHAILSFGRDQTINTAIGNWKHFHKHTNHVSWQEGFFDHRLRDDERGEQLSVKLDYIRQNPVAAGLCQKADDWPWVIDPPHNASYQHQAGLSVRQRVVAGHDVRRPRTGLTSVRELAEPIHLALHLFSVAVLRLARSVRT